MEGHVLQSGEGKTLTPELEYSTLALGALTFTVALAWNEAVGHAMRSAWPPEKRGRPRVAFACAIVMTLMVVAAIGVYNYCSAHLRTSHEAMRDNRFSLLSHFRKQKNKNDYTR